MLDINGTDIEINKNNSATFTITLTGDDTPDDNTIVLFVVKKHPNYTVPILTKTLSSESGILTVYIDPEDTASISPGEYYWNLIIQYESGDSPWTISKRALKFTVLPEIGAGYA